MKVHGKHYRTIWLKEGDPNIVQIIDQRYLPHKFVIVDLTTVDQVAYAIKEMQVRGAGLIGATAGYGMYIAALRASRDSEQAFTKAWAEGQIYRIEEAIDRLRTIQTDFPDDRLAKQYIETLRLV